MRPIHAVDKAEEQEDSANAINHLAVMNIAQIAKNNNIKLIHISTDYVFDGTNYKPYVEDRYSKSTICIWNHKISMEN